MISYGSLDRANPQHPVYQALLHKTGNHFHYLHMAIETIEEMYHCGKESSPYVG
jgi:hypothetical protein